MFSKCWGILWKLHGNCCHYHVFIKPTVMVLRDILIISAFLFIKGYCNQQQCDKEKFQKENLLLLKRKWELETWIKGNMIFFFPLEEIRGMNNNSRPSSKLLSTLNEFFWATFMFILPLGSRHTDTLSFSVLWFKSIRQLSPTQTLTHSNPPTRHHQWDGGKKQKSRNKKTRRLQKRQFNSKVKAGHSGKEK